MPQTHPSFLLLSLLIISLVSVLPALPLLPDPDPDPAAVQPDLVLPASSPPATIPAFPEQSDAASACPLDLSSELLHGVSRACSPSSDHRLPYRSRCCPALAAWLYSAYSATALGGVGTPTYYDLPVLPDDSESCVAGAEEGIRARGVALPRVNATCGVAYCYCGVRLRRLSCPGPFVASGEGGHWVPKDRTARRLEGGCATPGLAGCSRCLRALNQLKSGNVTGPAGEVGKTGGDRECQLMGLTWLLSENRTLYLPTATAVLRAFMAAPDAPASCSLSSDDLPLAVGSAQIDGDVPSNTVSLPLFSSSVHLLLPLILSSLL